MQLRHCREGDDDADEEERQSISVQSWDVWIDRHTTEDWLTGMNCIAAEAACHNETAGCTGERNFFFGGGACPSPLTSIENCTTQSYLQGGSNDVTCPQLMVWLIFVEVCVVLSQLLHNVTKMMPWPCHCKHQFSECRVWDKVPQGGTFIFGDTHILL